MSLGSAVQRQAQVQMLRSGIRSVSMVGQRAGSLSGANQELV